MNELTKTEMLFIRACKELKPRKRIFSVYRRFYGNMDLTDEERFKYIGIILAEIVMKFKESMDLIDLIAALDPNRFNNIGRTDTRSYNQRVFDTMVTSIRLTTPDDFPDNFIKARRFRDEL